MTVVVTGAGGLIGRVLVDRLAGDHEVWAISRATPPASHPRVRAIAADLAMPQVPAGLPDRADVVVHLVQSSGYRDFPAQALDIFNVNVGSTARLLDWSRAAGIRQFIVASSGGVDGGGSRSYYAASKLSAEALARCYSSEFGVLLLRFHFVYGRHQRRSMLVPRLIDTIKSGNPVPLAGADGPRLNPIYVDDAVRAIELAIERQVSGLIPIAGPDVVSVRQMSEIIGRRLSIPVTFTANETQHPQDLIGDVGEMSKRLAAPRWSFDAGIAEMLR